MKLLALIDSSALIGGLPPDVLNRLEDYCSSMIVRAELAYGLRAFEASGQAERATRRETLLQILDSIPEFWRDFDRAASDGYATLTARTKQAMRMKDALIAGHAQSLNTAVLTRDTGFTRFGSVEVQLLEP